jgi:hypothetical protein
MANYAGHSALHGKRLHELRIPFRVFTAQLVVEVRNHKRRLAAAHRQCRISQAHRIGPPRHSQHDRAIAGWQRLCHSSANAGNQI